jgi:HPt (histidine-containing phosphotransfer) domain-containing protein
MEDQPIGDVDWQGALKTVSGKRDLLLELVDLFFKEYPGLLYAIGEAFDRQRQADVVLYAHRLRGCLHYFGRNRAGEAAKKLEVAARAGDMGLADDAHRELKEALGGLTVRLNAFRDSGLMG